MQPQLLSLLGAVLPAIVLLYSPTMAEGLFRTIRSHKSGLEAPDALMPQGDADSNIVSNGSFEVPDVVPDSFVVYHAGFVFGDWTVESGSVDHISEHYWQAEDGLQSVDLAGSTNEIGSIYQDLPADVGTIYLLRFALAGNPEGGPPIKQVEVWWGPNLVDTVSFDITGHSNWSMGWTYNLPFA